MTDEKFTAKRLDDESWITGYLIRCGGSGKGERVFIAIGGSETTLTQQVFGGRQYDIGPFIEVDPDSVRPANEGHQAEKGSREKIDSYLAAAREEAARLGVKIDVSDDLFIDDEHRDCVWYGGHIGSLFYKGYEIEIFVSGETHIALFGCYENDRYDDKQCVGGWVNPDDTLRRYFAGDKDLFDATSVGDAYWENNSWVEYRIKDQLGYWHDGDVIDNDVVAAFGEISSWVDVIEKFDTTAVHLFKRREYMIEAERVNLGTQIYNKLEDCNYVAIGDECICMTGVVGEQWLVRISYLCEQYVHADGSVITPANIPASGKFAIRRKPDAKLIAARRETSRRVVTTRDGHKLWANRDGVQHGEGDCIVYEMDGDKIDFDRARVVNGEVFDNIYERA